VKVERQDEDGVVVLAITGRLTGGPDADDFRRVIAQLVEAKESKVLFDLSGVPWMNSAGIGVLVSSLASLRNAGAHVKFLNLNERVIAILKVTRLVAVFESYFRREDALQAFHEGNSTS
jgi:anti-sigma B factor antagonist